MTMTGIKRWSRLWLMCLAVATVLTGCWPFGSDDSEEPGPTAPVLTTQPSDTQAVAGSDVRFTAAAQDTGVTWAWQRSTDGGTTWVAVPNAGTASLALTGVTLADTNTRYRAVASSAGLQTFSSAALLTVTPTPEPPRITVDLSAQSVVTGSSVTFAVTATGTALQYQWQSSRDGNTWVDVAGATSATLQLQSVAFEANGTLYRVVVRNTVTSITSGAVLLTVSRPPAAATVTLQPVAVSVTAPNAATFTAAATGQPAPTLQWQRSTNNGTTYVDIAGANQPSYTTAATSLADTGTLYRLVASNSVGTAVSSAAALTVSPTLEPPVVITQPADATVPVGQSATFTAAFSGVPTPTYQWQFSADAGATFANINGATGSSYSVVAAQGDNGKRYRVVATNSAGTQTSRVVLLTVQTQTSLLLNRTWVPGTRFNSLSEVVSRSEASLDESGRMHVLYTTVSPTTLQYQLWGVSSLPGSTNSPANYGSPTLLATSSKFLIPSKITADAQGATASWLGNVSCPEEPVDGCSRLFSSRYSASVNAWSSAAEISIREAFLLAGKRNGVGDQVALISNSSDGVGFGEGYSLIWKLQGSTQVQSMNVADPIPNGSLTFKLPVDYSVDNNGRFIIVYSELAADQSRNLLIRRGSIRTNTLGPEEALETRSASASFDGIWSNGAGQTVVMWNQNNGTRVTEYAATLDDPNGSWSVVDTGLPSQNQLAPTATVSADGNFYWYSWSNCSTLRRVNGIWSTVSSLPNGVCLGSNASVALAPNGNVLVVDRATTRWATFDAARQEVVNGFVQLTTTGAGYVTGARWGSGSSTVMLTSSGIGAFVSVNNYDLLPSASAPAGDSRGTGTTFQNVWGVYFK